MKNVKSKYYEVPTDEKEELDKWQFDSHMWVREPENRRPHVVIYCKWCGRTVGNRLCYAEIPMCPNNPRIKKLYLDWREIHR